MAKREVCMIDGCTRDTYALGLCNPCYARARYWDGRSLNEKLERAKNLRIYGAGMSQSIGSTNVRSLPTKKKARGRR